MSDHISPPAGPPSPPLPSPGRESGITVIRNATVSSAPQGAAPQQDGKTITLRAVAVEDKTLPPDQLRLKTDKGDIIIRSDTRLPPDTEVMVDLQRQKTALIASVRVAQRSAEIEAPAAQQQNTQPATQPRTDAPPPQPSPQTTVQPGDKLIALLLSGSLPPSAPPPASTPALTPDQAALIRQTALQLLAGGGGAKTGVPLSVLTGLAGSSDPAAFINLLPPDQQAALRLLLPAAPAPTATAPAAALTAPSLSSAVPSPADAEASDHSLLSVLKAMTSARLTSQAIGQASPAPQDSATAMTRLIKSMLPLIEGVQSQGLMQHIGSTAASPAGAFAAQPSGAELKILRISLPTADGAAPALPTTAGGAQRTLEGLIIGQTRDGMAVIKTPLADFVLSTRINLPVGTALTFDATPLSFSELAARLSGTGGAPALLAGGGLLGETTWPALDEALALLVQSRPEVAARITATVPSPGPQMVPGTLFFLAALRLGIVENWLGGTALQGLRDSGARSTADKLAGDFGRIARQAGEPLPGEWRGISMPVLYDSQLSQVNMFVRRQKDESGDPAGGGKTTRFIVNLTLSRLGGMQLDGLLHEAAPATNESKRLDMVIRTDQRLSPGIMQDLQTAYAAGLKDSKMAGALEFQAQRKGWVEVQRTPQGAIDA